jgi:hypothetical protein
VAGGTLDARDLEAGVLAFGDQLEQLAIEAVEVQAEFIERHARIRRVRVVPFSG